MLSRIILVSETSFLALVEHARSVLQDGGKGKSGDYRVITFYSGDDIPVFLLNIFGKG